jgi:hypothetical protein
VEVVLLSNLEVPVINQVDLVAAWQQTLPIYLNETDRVKVTQDEMNPNWIRIHIDTAGRSLYSFDFCTFYLDSREIKVDFVSAHQDHKLLDEKTDEVQELIKDYVRHIHECAQALQKVTHR